MALKTPTGKRKFAYTALASSVLLWLCTQATPALAQNGWTGSGCQSTDQTNCTIDGAVSGNLTANASGAKLTINSGAILTATGSGNAVTVSGQSGVSITNNGTIDASSATHGIAVKGSGSQATIETNGNISGNWHAISVEGGGVADITIGSGASLTSNRSSTVYFDGSVPSGASTASKLTNNGKITSSVSNAIDLGNNGGGGSGTYVTSIVNGQTGTIYAPSHNGAGLSIFSAENSKIDSIENKGTITGWAGMRLRRGTVGTITNSGTIQGLGSGGDYYWSQQIGSAIVITTFNSVLVLVDKIDNQSTGKILSGKHAAISNTVGRINTLSNAGLIESTGEDAIRIMRGADIRKIENASGGKIKGYTNGINLIADVQWTPSLGRYADNLRDDDTANIDKVVIDIQSGSEVTGQTNAGINLKTQNTNWAAYVYGSINVGGTVSGANYGLYSNVNVLGKITVSGTVSSNNSEYALVNEGTLGGLEVKESGNITGFKNTGTVTGDVVLSTSKPTNIYNPGTIQGSLKVNGTGEVYIKDWGVNVVANDDPNASTSAKAEVVNNITLGNGANANQIKIEHITINSINQALLNSNIDMSNVFQIDGQTHDLPNEASAVTIGSLPSNLGFDGTYDPKTKTFYTSFNVAQTAGAVVSQTLANQLMRRDFFLESAITEAATGSLYHRKLDGVDGTVFVKPYASSDLFDLSGAEMDGTTQGVMMGINRFVGRHLLTGFVGYERSEIDSNFRSSVLNLDVQSWYGGFNTAHLLQSNSLVDTFLKGSLKASYTTTGIDRSITLNANTTSSDNTVGSNASVIASSAKPGTVAVGMNVQMGMNFKPMKETQIIPMVGLGYSIGKTSSYQLDRTGLINDAYMPERVMMPYADASVTWFQGWGKIVRTFVGGGMRYILDRTQKTALSYGKLPIEGEYSLPQSFQYVNASMVLHITHHSEIALGYTGVFDSTGHSQNLTTKYELHF